ncbi:MAG: IspD/TarI family cytidylyltransferase, partial [Sciscionella sp.]
VEIGGRSIIEYAIEAFDSHPLVDEVLVVMVSERVDQIRDLIECGGYTKVRHVLPGGATRSDSAVVALRALADDNAKVLLHDAARPFVGPGIITACFQALDEYDAVTVAVPSSDTIVEVADNGTVAAVPDRTRLRRSQSPQAFRLGVIRAAYRAAAHDPEFAATDDASVVWRYLPHVPVLVLPGDELNMKVTTPLDVHFVEKLLEVHELSPLPSPNR